MKQANTFYHQLLLNGNPGLARQSLKFYVLRLVRQNKYYIERWQVMHQEGVFSYHKIFEKLEFFFKRFFEEREQHLNYITSVLIAERFVAVEVSDTTKAKWLYVADLIKNKNSR